ncbi:hypothetical protein SAMN05421806_102288 [Streptomyces indicus]|uniref:Uncharacterized protein n=1 Tax=Streptomyces indicus TaxID=417292 RepID=A0A1G8W7M1_9ACTN|nr:hypothetical protein SAMN05421806_102288 [Streptomyces indicus]
MGLIRVSAKPKVEKPYVTRNKHLLLPTEVRVQARQHQQECKLAVFQ